MERSSGLPWQGEDAEEMMGPRAKEPHGSALPTSGDGWVGFKSQVEGRFERIVQRRKRKF